MKRTLQFLMFGLGLTLAACSGGGPDDAPQPAPDTGTLVFWARGQAGAVGLPITVFVGTDSVGRITELAPPAQAAAPSTGNAQLRVQRNAGTYTVRARNAFEQVWVGSLTVTTNGSAEFLMESPNTGTASFWASSVGNTDNSAITVVLDGGDTLGRITNRLAAAPACGAAGTLTRARAGGTYTYFAFNASGSCVWTGQVSFTNGTCATPVQLAACNN